MRPSPRSRRAFLRDLAATGAGLAVAVHLPGCTSIPRRGAGPEDWVPNAVLRITPDDRIVFTLARVEMGQGTLTSETMFVAEELGAELSEVEVEHAPADRAYANPDWVLQTTGGSNSTRSSFEPLRRAAASVREALLAAAAETLGAPRAELELRGKVVVHTKTGERLPIGGLTERAKAHLGDAEPKPRAEWRLLGRSQTRKDAQSKSDGSAVFSADLAPEGVEVAVVVRGPFGGRLLGFDADEASKQPGVKAVFEIPSGVAVVADGYHRAKKAARLVEADWSKSEVSTEALFKEYAAKLDEGYGDEVRDDGDVEDALEAATPEQTLEAEYALPFVAHACMEPMTATAWVRPGRTDIWLPTQSPAFVQLRAAEIAGVDADEVHVHQTLLGGAFGRKSLSDYAEEAVAISKARRAPVRLIWSREDDIRHGFYRPATLHRLKAVVREGRPVAWGHRMAGQSSMFDLSEPMLEEIVPGFLTGLAQWGAETFGHDNSIVEGAHELPYAIEHVRVGYHRTYSPVPSAIWRSVGFSHNGFVVESFVDELAHAAKQDPLQFRKTLLAGHPRHLACLEAVERMSRWGEWRPRDRALGVAVVASFESVVAEVAEVSVEDGRPRVHDVWAAVHCGTAINPDGVKAQIEGGVIFGLSAALTQQAITVEDGWVQQSNFHDFEVLRMHECPNVHVEIIESDAPPTGTGEPGVPPAAPAVANAVFALTGERLRRLPLRLG